MPRLTSGRVRSGLLLGRSLGPREPLSATRQKPENLQLLLPPKFTTSVESSYARLGIFRDDTADAAEPTTNVTEDHSDVLQAASLYILIEGGRRDSESETTHSTAQSIDPSGPDDRLSRTCIQRASAACIRVYEHLSVRTTHVRCAVQRATRRTCLRPSDTVPTRSLPVAQPRRQLRAAADGRGPRQIPGERAVGSTRQLAL
jgi:hypothetical protein